MLLSTNAKKNLPDIEDDDDDQQDNNNYDAAERSSSMLLSSATKAIDDSVVQRIARVSAARQQPNFATGKTSRTLPSLAVANPLLAGHKTYSDLLDTVQSRSHNNDDSNNNNNNNNNSPSKKASSIMTMMMGGSSSSPSPPRTAHPGVNNNNNNNNTSGFVGTAGTSRSHQRSRSKSPLHISRSVKNAKPVPVIGPFGVRVKKDR